MSIGLIGLIILILLSSCIGFIAHRKIRNYIVACIISGIISSIIFQILNIIYLGTLDPFFFIAFATGSVLAFVIAIIVGIPIAYLRFKRERTESDFGEEEGQ